MGSWFGPERHSNTHAPPVLVHYSHHLIYQANLELVIFWIRYIPVQDDCDKVVFWSRPDDIKRNFRWYSEFSEVYLCLNSSTIDGRRGRGLRSWWSPELQPSAAGNHDNLVSGIHSGTVTLPTSGN